MTSTRFQLAERVLTFASRTVDLQLQLADRLELVHHDAGHLIFFEGAAGDAAYVIVEGFVQIFVTYDSGTAVLAKLGSGDFFGEQALLSDSPRSASARAHTEVSLLKLAKDDFATLIRDSRAMLESKGRVEAGFRRLLRTRGFWQLFADPDHAPEERVFADGTVVFREGDDPDGLYWIRSGAADVLRNQAGTVLEVCRLAPGSVFGEKAILDRTKRSATIRARGELRAWFATNDRVRGACGRTPELAEHLARLHRVYQLPRRGIVTQTVDVAEGDEPAVLTVYDLPDGRQVAATHRNDAFIAERVDSSVEPPELWRRVADGERGVWLSSGGEILKVCLDAEWDGLSAVVEMLLDGSRVPEAESQSLGGIRRHAGEATADDQIVCRCMNVSASTIRRAVSSGSRSVDALQRDLGCGAVCGGCKPTILELTGVAAWTAVRVETERRVAGDIGIVSLQPVHAEPRASLPGQHIVIRARIDGVPVQRPYTLTNGGSGSGSYEIAVKKEPSGTFSPWFLERRPEGCILEMSWPEGAFVWDPARDHDAVALVAGIGVTPAVAFARAKLRGRLRGRLLVHYSVKSRDEAAFVEELQEAAATHADIRFTCRETTREGRLTAEEVVCLVREYPAAQYFICGPRRFNDDVRRLLAEAGVPPGAINVEVFLHQGDPIPMPTGTERRALPPMPPGRFPVLGHVGVLRGPLLFFLLSEHRRMGPIFRVNLGLRGATVMGGAEASLFFLEHPDLFSQEATFRVFPQAWTAKRALIAMDGEPHRCLRSALSPSFSASRFTPGLYAQIITAVDAFTERCAPGDRLWANPKLGRLSIAVSNLIWHGRSASPDEIEIGVKLRRSMRLQYATTQPVYFPWLPYAAHLRRNAARMAEGIVHEREAGAEGSLLAQFSRAAAERGATFEDDVVRGTMLLPFTIGQDSWSTTLEFLLFCIHRDGELSSSIKREAAQLFATDDVTTERLGRMRYLRSAVYESLRMFPFFPALPVTTTREFEFAGYRVGRGSLVLVAHPITNFSPELFAAPLEFEWGRFLDKEPNPLALRTFGIGPHACMAREMVPWMLTLVAARLVHRLELALTSRELRYRRQPFLRLAGRPIVVKSVRTPAIGQP